MRYLILITFLMVSYGQDYKKVEFNSIDGLKVTADLYEVNKSHPTIIAFHQSASSRGEYRNIAPKLMQEGFNVLAVDLRWGNQDFWNKIENETAKRFGTPDILKRYDEGRRDEVWPTIDASFDDMLASIDWLYMNNYSGKNIVMGSSFSSILIFELAQVRDVAAVLSYSPGEYRPTDTTRVARSLQTLTVPTYFASGAKENFMVKPLFESMPNPQKVLYQAEKGRHGASILFQDDANMQNLIEFLTPFKASKEVTFNAADGVKLFADFYGEQNSNKPILLMFHQGGANVKAEYGPFAHRLVASGYNILAVDLRRGGRRLGGKNRTIEALDKSKEYTYCDAYPDLVAAMNYLDQINYQGKRIAWGSSFSAALVTQLAAEHSEKLAGILAFSPASGKPMEGCQPKQFLDQVKIPALFIRPAREMQLKSVQDQFALFKQKNLNTYVARNAVHGSSLLNQKRVKGSVEASWSRVLEFLREISHPTS